MAENIDVVPYSDTDEFRWDRFVLQESINGTFLQSRNFLNYHRKGKFADHSLIFTKGTNIVAVIPAHIVEQDGRKCLVSHQGSTFGGIVLGEQFKKLANVEAVFEAFHQYVFDNKIDSVQLKMTGDIYTKDVTDILEYYFFMNGYETSCEVGYYIDFDQYNNEIISNFTASRRRHYNNSLQYNLTFKQIFSDDEIELFYDVLSDNQKKFNKTPVHSIDELLDLKNNRLKDIVQFFGVYSESELIAGSMVFCFDKNVFHTQYLACRQDQTDTHANEFLYKHLIDEAKKSGFAKLSFGTSTLEGGKVLNKSLAQFKEGFGTTAYVNRTYRKNFDF